MATGNEKFGSEGCRGFWILIAEQVGVDVRGYGGVGVPELLANVNDFLTPCDPQRGVGMPQ